MLVKSEFPLDIPNLNGISALGIASCSKHYINIARTLVDGGANINYTREDGLSPLSLAIQNDNYTGVKYLVKKKALIYYKNRLKRENSPIFMTIKMQNVRFIEYLCDNGADLTVRNA
jgi:ankyrin repeat protein